MKIAAKVASALSFAHLAGVGRKVSAKARAEDDEDKDKPERDHEDGNVKKGRAEEDDKDKRDDIDDDDHAEGDDTDDEASEDERDNDDADEKKGKKAKSAKAEGDDDKGDDDSDEEMRGSSASAKARRREQARCAAIFASPAAARNPVLAANLAFKTRMSRTEALAVLEATPAGNASGNASRAARNPNVGAGGSAQPTSPQAAASSWDRAFAKANGRRI